MYGKLTSQAAEVERMNQADRRWNLPDIGSALLGTIIPFPPEYVLELRAKMINALLLKAGGRIHIRIGYGSDASTLPIAFNGRITEVPVTEGAVQVIALGDGHELKKDIPPQRLGNTRYSQDAYNETGFGGGGKDPRNIILELFTTTAENVFGEIAYRLTRGIYFGNNAFGIENFGRANFTSNWYTLGFSTSVDAGEMGVNVYEPRYDLKAVNRGTAVSNVLGWVWSNSDVLLGVSVENATPWRVIETCRKACPDFYSVVETFGLRSTLFLGKSWFDLHYDYDYDFLDETILKSRQGNQNVEIGPKEVHKYMKKKPFQQTRVVSSSTNLLETKIATSTEELYTASQFVEISQALTPFNEHGSIGDNLKPSSIKYFDNEIYTENIRIKTGRSGLYCKFNTRVGDVVKNFMLSSKPNENYAVAELLEGMKKMYQGSILVRGDASYRPFNLIYLSDDASGLKGMIEAREVVHRLSLEGGFTTTITPDLCVHAADSLHLNKVVWMAQVAGGIAAIAAARKVNAILLRKLFNGGLIGKGLDGVAEGVKNFARTKMDPTSFDDFAKNIDNVVGDMKNRKLFLEGGHSKELTDELLSRVKQKLSDGKAVVSKGSKLTIDLVKSIGAGILEALGDGKAASLINNINASIQAAKASKTTASLVGASKNLANFIKTNKALGGAFSFIKGAFTLGATIETLGLFMIVPSLIEAFNRKLNSRKCAVCLPLRLRGKEFSAGIEGHKGGVLGDNNSWFNNLLLRLTNFDYNVQEEIKDLNETGGPNLDKSVIGYLNSVFGGMLLILGVQSEANTTAQLGDNSPLLKAITEEEEVKAQLGIPPNSNYPNYKQLINLDKFSGPSGSGLLPISNIGPANIVAPEVIQKVLSKSYEIKNRGAKYTFGANSQDEVDCSSFVQQSFASVGIRLPRTTDTQHRACLPVSTPQPGDLVFFKGTYRPGISHVGIYIGNSKMIHASSTAGKVIEASIDTPYNRTHFHSFRRVPGI